MKGDPRPAGRPRVSVPRDAMISVRVTDAEYAMVLANASAAHQDLADFVRHRLLFVNINSTVITLVPH